MEHALTLSHVTKRFGDFVAVDDLSLEIPRGSIYGFIGPNGAGKTTTLRMVMSIFYPDAGEITVLGNPRPEAVKDRLGYLPEEKGLYKSMRVGEIVAYFGRLKGIPGGEAQASGGFASVALRARRLDRQEMPSAVEGHGPEGSTARHAGARAPSSSSSMSRSPDSTRSIWS